MRTEWKRREDTPYLWAGAAVPGRALANSVRGPRPYVTSRQARAGSSNDKPTRARERRGSWGRGGAGWRG
jgi:hypothetical protein